MVESNVTRRMEGRDCSTSSSSAGNGPLSTQTRLQLQDGSTSTQGCQRAHNEMTLNDKSSFSNETIQDTLLFQMLPAASIGNGKGSLPCYPSRETEKLKRSLSRVGIDCADLALNYSKKSSNSTKLDSWFLSRVPKSPKNNNSQKISWQSSMCSAAGETGYGVTKIRLLPTPRQKKILTLWLKNTRLTYNACIDKIVNNPDKYNFKKKLGRGEFDSKFVNKGCGTTEQLKTQCFSSATSRQIAALEAITAYNNETIRSSTRFAKEVAAKRRLRRDMFRQNKTEQEIEDALGQFVYQPTFRRRGRNDKFHSFTISHESMNIGVNLFGKNVGVTSFTLAPTTKFPIKPDVACNYKCKNLCKHYLLGEIKTKVRKISMTDFVDSKIVYTCGQWFLHLVGKTEPKATRSSKTCAIDPGVRTFMTLTDIDGNVTELGINPMKKLERLHRRQDNSQAELQKWIRMSKETKKLKDKKLEFQCRMTTLNTKRKLDEATAKIKNKINDMHHKIAKRIVTEYDNILYPPLSTTSIVKNHANKFNRQLYCLAHFKFTQLLSHKAKIHGKKLVEVDEAYTTKTCLNCLRHVNVGASKVFSCTCGYSAGRDINAAFNILLKNVGEVPRATGDREGAPLCQSSLLKDCKVEEKCQKSDILR